MAVVMVYVGLKRWYTALYLLLGWKPVGAEQLPLDAVGAAPRWDSAIHYLSGPGFKPLVVERIRLFLFSRVEHEWLCAAEDGQIYVELAHFKRQDRVLVLFLTCFADDAMLMTGYPIGENVDAPMFHSHFAAYSLQ